MMHTFLPTQERLSLQKGPDILLQPNHHIPLLSLLGYLGLLLVLLLKKSILRFLLFEHFSNSNSYII